MRIKSLLLVSSEEQKFKIFLVVLFNNYFLLGIVFVVSNPNSQEFYLIFPLEVMQFCFLFWIMVSFKLNFFNVRWEMTQSNFLACVDTIIPAPFVKKEKKRSILHWIVFIGQKLVDCTCSSLFRHYIFLWYIGCQTSIFMPVRYFLIFYWDYNNIVDLGKIDSNIDYINVINLDIDIEIYPQNRYISPFT